MNLDSRRSAPDRLARASDVPLESPPKMRRLARCRLARSAKLTVRLQPDRLAPDKWAPFNTTAVRFACLKSTPDRSSPDRFLELRLAGARTVASDSRASTWVRSMRSYPEKSPIGGICAHTGAQPNSTAQPARIAGEMERPARREPASVMGHRERRFPFARY